MAEEKSDSYINIGCINDLSNPKGLIKVAFDVEIMWVFCHMYSKPFLEKYQIRMNVSHSNEDTGFNRLVAGCTNRIWFLGDYSGLYMWRHKNTSITRFNNGMYGGGSGVAYTAIALYRVICIFPPVNCFESLKPLYHNVVRNNKRDGYESRKK